MRTINVDLSNGIPESFRKTCRGPTCDAQIAMAITTNSKWQPIEPMPDPTGNIVVEVGEDHRLRCHVADLFDAPGPRFWPHHGRCPDVDQFRR